MAKIKIITTSDLHCNIFPHNYSDNVECAMGLAKLKKAIDIVKDENTIIIDNGDSLQGSALSFYHQYKDIDNIHPMTLAMHEVGYDYINIGNHDFNYGLKELKKHLVSIDVPCITSNISIDNIPLSDAYHIHTFNNGLRIALIGLCTHYIPHYENASNIEGCSFIDCFQSLRATVNLVKQKEDVDYIIGVYHGGFERDIETGELVDLDTGENQGYKMCKEIEGLDVLITGHQHKSLLGKINDVAITQTSANGVEFSLVEIDNENDEIELSIVKCEDSVDQNIISKLQDVEDKTQSWLDEVVGHSEVDLKITDEFDARLHKHNLVTFMNNVQKDFAQTDLSAFALFNNITGFNPDITIRNIISTYVYPNTLVTKEIDGKTLKLYLEKCAEYFDIVDNEIVVANKFIAQKPKHYNYDMVDGISYEIHVANPVGNRITNINRNGELIKEDDVFTIVMNNYRANGGGNFDMIKEAKTIKEYDQSMVEILINYIISHKTINFEKKDNIEISL